MTKMVEHQESKGMDKKLETRMIFLKLFFWRGSSIRILLGRRGKLFWERVSQESLLGLLGGMVLDALDCLCSGESPAVLLCVSIGFSEDLEDLCYFQFSTSLQHYMRDKSLVQGPNMGVSQNKGYHFGGPNNKD